MQKENIYDSVELTPLSKPEPFHEWRKPEEQIKTAFVIIITAAIAKCVQYVRRFPWATLALQGTTRSV